MHPVEPCVAVAEFSGAIRMWYCLNKEGIEGVGDSSCAKWKVHDGDDRLARRVGNLHWHKKGVSALIFSAILWKSDMMLACMLAICAMERS